MNRDQMIICNVHEFVQVINLLNPYYYQKSNNFLYISGSIELSFAVEQNFLS